MKLASAMISCPDRADVRCQTLANLGATDWADAVALVIDEGRGPDRLGRIDVVWQRAIQLAAESQADVTLLLEDDLDFNRHLRANILDWLPLVGVDGTTPFFASLYNPGFYAVHTRCEDRYRLMDPNGCWGAQALLVSRALARYFVAHWSEVPGNPDQRMPRLAGRFVPIYYHYPSLVQHVGTVSTWGGRDHHAQDFQRDWRALVGGTT